MSGDLNVFILYHVLVLVNLTSIKSKDWRQKLGMVCLRFTEHCVFFPASIQTPLRV